MAISRLLTTAAAAFAAPRNSLNWGIMSAGKISSDFVKALSITEGATAASIAARSPKSATKFAEEHNIPRIHQSYEELVNDPSIDAVYVGSIADTHYELTKMCLEANKPTLVEKPLALTAVEAKELCDIAQSRDVFLMEGMWTRCFPAVKKAKQIISSGAIGDVVCVQGDFGWNTKDCDETDRMWNLTSGGMTYDIGMYMAQLGQVAFPGAGVHKVSAMPGNSRNGVDQTVLANICYEKVGSTNGSSPNFGMLQFYVSGEANTEERVVFQGTKGRITFTPPAHTPTSLTVSYDTGRGESKEEFIDYGMPDDSWTTWNYPRSICFSYEIEDVNQCILKGKTECEHFNHSDTIQLATVLDEILVQVRGKHPSAERLMHLNNGTTSDITITKAEAEVA